MDNHISSDLIRGHIDTIILQSLSEKDLYPQQIIEYVLHKSNGKYELNQATLYSSLKRLEHLKQVESYWHDIEDGRRKFYKLTDLGKEVIKENAENWIYSCDVINELIGVKPKIVETVIEKPVVYVKNDINQEKNSDIYIEKAKETDVNIGEKTESLQELNFRSVIKDLVAGSRTETPVQNQEIPVIEKIETKETVNEKTDLNKVIKGDIFSNSTHYIKFDDVVEKAEKDGFKVRISSSEEKFSSKNGLLLNKMKMFSVLAVYLLSLCEFLIFSVAFKDIFKLNFLTTLIVLVFLTLYPVFCVRNYIKEPLKTIPKLKKDYLLTAFIVIFDLILLMLAVILFFDIKSLGNFGVIFEIVTITLLADSLCYFIIMHVLAKSKKFRLDE